MKKLIVLVFLSAFLSVQVIPAFASDSFNSIEVVKKGGDKKKKKDKSKEACDKTKMSCCKDMAKTQKSCCKKPVEVKDDVKK
jgi:hypothetical protein